MNGDDQKPGAGRENVTLATVRPKIVASVCAQAFSSMMMANPYASTRVPRLPAPPIPTEHQDDDAPISPASHTPKLNVGIGHQPSRSRIASTVGL